MILIFAPIGQFWSILIETKVKCHENTFWGLISSRLVVRGRECVSIDELAMKKSPSSLHPERNAFKSLNYSRPSTICILPFAINYTDAGIVSPAVSPDRVPCALRGEWVGWPPSSAARPAHILWPSKELWLYASPLLSSTPLLSSRPSAYPRALYLASVAAAGEGVRSSYISLLSLVSAKVVANPTTTRLTPSLSLSLFPILRFVSLIGSGNCCPLSFHFH